MVRDFLRKYQRWYISYLDMQNNKNETDRLSYYRDKLFISIITLTVLLGSVAYVPSITAAIILDKWFILYIDTLAIILLFFAFFYKPLSLKHRKQIFTVNFFVLSLCLVLDLGLGGNGPILLYMVSILVTLYSSTKAGVYTVLLTALFYFLVLVIKYFKIIEINFYVEGPFEGLMTVFINNILFSLLTVFCVAFLIKQLNRALLKEAELQNKLIEENKLTIKAKEKAEQSDRLKTAFLSNMSHEINTPMYSVLGSTALLKSSLNIDEKNKEYFNIIETNSNKILKVFNDVLEVSKIESGVYTINTEPISIESLLENVKTDLSPLAKAHKVKLMITVEIKQGYRLLSDQEKLYEALKHLVKNAITFTKPYGVVNVICNILNDKKVEFKIQDTGIGIADKDLDKVRLPFFKVDLDNESALHGAGLGLTIANAYINILGGKIKIESALGHGTQIYFTLEDYKKAP